MSEKGKREVVLQGIAASPGVAHGPAFVFRHRDLEVPAYRVAENRLQQEVHRFEQALLLTRQQIMTIRSEIAQKLSEDEAAIFDAHLLVLEDRALIDETIRETEQSGYNIDYIFQKVATRYIDAFLKIDDEYIKERVADIRDVSRRLLHNLLGRTPHVIGSLAEPRILVCEDLSPSDAASIDRDKVLGIMTDLGGRTSHAVIVSRSLELPAVIGLHTVTQEVESGDTLLVDGYDGRVVINPAEETLYRYGKIKLKRESISRVFLESAELEPRTRDGRLVRIMANVESPAEMDPVQRSRACGIGLFRTEIFYLRESGALPDEEEQFQAYNLVAAAMAPKPVILRTLDLGGDKMVAHSSRYPREDNPFLGFRAIRISLEQPEVFKTQLRAILRASAHGNVKVMYPMISGVDEIVQANALLQEAKDELRQRGELFDPNLPVGCMIEIPSAAYIADLLAEHCSFFSIGTNDLIQYMLAVDRVNDRIAHLYNPAHPAILRTLKHVFEAGERAGIPVSVCGEMAGDPLFAPLLIGLGASDLSAAPASIPEMKFVVRSIGFRQTRELVDSVLHCNGGPETDGLLQDFYKRNVADIVEGML